MDPKGGSLLGFFAAEKFTILGVFFLQLFKKLINNS